MVCDDASTDGSVEEIRRLIDEHPGRTVRLLENEKNRGVCVTRNRAMAAGRGRVSRLPGRGRPVGTREDRAPAGGVRTSVPEVGLVFTGARPLADEATREWLRSTPGLTVDDVDHWAANDNALFERFRPRDRWEYFDLFLTASFLCWSSVVVRRATAEAVGGFDTQLGYQSEDWLFVLSCLCLGEIEGSRAGADPLPPAPGELHLPRAHPGLAHLRRGAAPARERAARDCGDSTCGGASAWPAADDRLGLMRYVGGKVGRVDFAAHGRSAGRRVGEAWPEPACAFSSRRRSTAVSATACTRPRSSS